MLFVTIHNALIAGSKRRLGNRSRENSLGWINNAHLLLEELFAPCYLPKNLTNDPINILSRTHKLEQVVSLTTVNIWKEGTFEAWRMSVMLTTSIKLTNLPPNHPMLA
jgi:hypothetical protein